MRVAHFSDCHLGRRQYYRSTSAGINQREADGALAFRRAVDGIVEAKPDLILCAGDLFDAVLPGNLARLEASKQFKRLGAAAPTLICAGNHETPKSTGAGSPLLLLAEAPGVTVAHQDQTRWEGEGVGVCLMPHAAVLRADQAVAGNQPIEILLIHGAVPGLHAPSDLIDGVGAPFDPSASGSWSYVALGDYHVCRQVAANAWYSGSLEFVSSNPWGELNEQPVKGWLHVELEPGRAPGVGLRAVETRRYVDHPVIDGAGRPVAEVAALLPEVEPGAVVRQVVTGLSRADRRALGSLDQVRAAKLRALHYNLDVRIAKREAQPIDAEPREQWEIDQDRDAAYWDGTIPLDKGPLPTPEEFNECTDPYGLDEQHAAWREARNRKDIAA